MTTTIQHKHEHNASHEHEEHSCSANEITEFRGVKTKRLIASLVITIAFMLIELIGGILVNSISLINDAGHMFTHALSITIALSGIQIAKRPPCTQKTFGSYRAEILAAFMNGIFLLIVVGYLIYEAIMKIIYPEPIIAEYMLIIAIMGLLVNIISIKILHGSQKGDINIKGVLTHLAADTGSSVGVVIAAIVVFYTGWTYIDPLISLGISVLILNWSMNILKESGRILLEISPEGMSGDIIRKDLLDKFQGRISDVYHIHVWTITSNMNVVSFHVSICDDSSKTENIDALYAEINEYLRGKYHIQETTIQIAQNSHYFACSL
jgi:cobalt-zinc-cadmium efflux system protein